jgi:predicted nucleotidyltransferase
MIDARAIEAAVDEIARACNPQRIILFGSYASGTPTEDSDIDLMVVKRYRGDSADASTRIRIGTQFRVPMDLLVRSPAEIRRRLEMQDFFIMDIVEQGIILHERDDERVGRQGRRRLRRRPHSSSVAKAQPV